MLRITHVDQAWNNACYYVYEKATINKRELKGDEEEDKMAKLA